MSTDPAMPIDSTRAKTLVAALQSVAERVAQTSTTSKTNVRLIAVSKLKPASDILALHEAPARHEHFGENYAQELMDKAERLPDTIRWHFIGGLQTNKCKPLASSIPNLWCVSSIDSIKKATALDAGRASLAASSSHLNLAPLNVHVQVNTSGEESKSGAAPGDETKALCVHIVDACPHLSLLGLMTIGAIARSQAVKEGAGNEDFVALRDERDRVAAALKRDPASLELSMGMSDDFEEAIRQGSGEVRVGSTIFGTRPPKSEAVV